VSLFNVDEQPGSIGRIPAYLKHRFQVALVKFDVEQEEPYRNHNGLCEACSPNEVGEALGKLNTDVASRFEGYAGDVGSTKRILRDVFEPGDTWFRTGDLMRKDERGFFYFVDRIGDTFRWKGENVSTSEVAEAICTFPGVRESNVYGVAIPGAEGRAGMATIAVDEALDLKRLRHHLIDSLPVYARPLFLRLRKHMDVTGTFKYTKFDLVREGYDPDATEDAIFFDSCEHEAFVPVDTRLYERIRSGLVTAERRRVGAPR
jgi:fatty-acyl-CoA synthase